MSNAADIKEIEMSIEDAKLSIQRKEALVRLEQNQDFKTIIGEGFLEKHAVRQVLLKSHPGCQAESIQKGLDMQIIAIGSLKQFFISIFNEGTNAEEAMANDEKTLEELNAEGLDK